MAGLLGEITKRSASGSSLSPRSTRPTGPSLTRPRPRARKALADLRRSRRNSALPVLTDVHEAGQCAASPKSSTCCKFRPFSAGRPISWSPRPDRQGRERQEGPVPGALGHEACARQDHRQRQSQRPSHRRGASFGYNRWCPTCAACRSSRRPVRRHLRRDPFGPAAWRSRYGERRRARFVPVLARAAGRSGSPAFSSRRTRTRTRRRRMGRTCCRSTNCQVCSKS